MKRLRKNPEIAARESNRQRRWRANNPGRVKEYMRNWSAENRERRYQRQKEYVARHLPAVRSYMNARRARLRAEFIVAYGGRCSCCGESREEFLTLDHHGETGRRLKKEHGRRGGAHVYEMLKRQGWPQEGLRLFCMNCNWAVRRGGTCPHARDGQCIERIQG